MLRRFVRWCLSFPMPWIVHGTEVHFWVIRDDFGAYLAFVDPFGMLCMRRFSHQMAKELGSSLSMATFDAERGLPLKAEMGSGCQFYNPE